MADLDTTSKRRSGLQTGHPFVVAFPEPTAASGNIDAADRQHVASVYAGILVGGGGGGGTVFRRGGWGSRSGSRQVQG